MDTEGQRRALRRRFDRAAPRYESAAVLDAEVARRMLERLDLVRLDPARILDLGAGTGRDQRALRARYPRAAVVAADHSIAMLREARSARGFVARMFGRAAGAVAADAHRLPFAAGAFDLAWSNLTLHWADDAPAVFRELARALRPEGLLMFSTFGPDTLRELAHAGAEAGGSGVRAFADMHDLGDALVAAGFADPVMDSERIVLSYADARACLADLRAAALSAGARLAPRGLGGRTRVHAIANALDRRRAGGRLSITFEVVQGHAWRGVPKRTTEGHAIVRTDFGMRRVRTAG